MSKFMMTFFVTVGGVIGSYIPIMLWHADGLSFWSILGGAIGGFAGIWAAIKYNQLYGS